MASKKFTNVYIKDNFAIVGPLERDGLLIMISPWTIIIMVKEHLNKLR